jgi:sodium-type flagellar protein MotY
MKGVTRLLLLIAALVHSPLTSARSVGASINNSVWKIHNEAEACELKHELPGFGTGVFRQDAGHPVTFSVYVPQGPQKSVEDGVKLIYDSPEWQQGHDSGKPIHFTLHAGRVPIELSGDESFRLLDHLQQGLQPTFVFEDWTRKGEELHLELVPVRFMPAFKAFERCRKNIPPVTFDSVEKRTIYYPTGGMKFNRESQRILMDIRDYIKANPNIKNVRLFGFTDNVGSSLDNRELAIKRIASVREYLMKAGYPEDKFQLLPYGERRPIATNDTKEGRAKNRRVVIQLIR